MMKQKRKDIIRWCILTLFLLVLFLLQTTPGLLPVLGKAGAMLLIPAVVCIGMFERETAGAFFGLIAGLLWDMASAQPIGFHSIILMCVGCISGLLITHLMRNSLLSGLLLGIVGIVLHTMLYWVFFVLLRGYSGAVTLLYSQFFPSMLYTAFFIPLFYFILRILRKQLRSPI